VIIVGIKKYLKKYYKYNKKMFYEIFLLTIGAYVGQEYQNLPPVKDFAKLAIDNVIVILKQIKN